MYSAQKLFATSALLFLLVSALALSNGDQQDEYSVENVNVTETLNKTGNQIVGADSDYHWTNNDDYTETDPPFNYLEDEPLVNERSTNISESSQAPQTSTNSVSTTIEITSESSVNLPSQNSSNITSAATEDSLLTSTSALLNSSNHSTDQDDQVATTASTAATTEEPKMTSLPSTSTDSTDLTSQSPLLTSTFSPRPIITQDVSDISNYSSTAIYPDEVKEASRTWAVVVFSILMSFAAILTILYFIRQAVIKRRKEDQRKLLKSSVSSEGYFFGDGDGDGNSNYNNGKFEL